VQDSRRRLIPLIHETSKGVYQGDGIHPGDEPKTPLFVMRSCRSKSGWCKRRLQASEILSMHDSDSVTKRLTDELRSKIIKLDYLSPLKVLLYAAHAVLRAVPGGVDLIPECSVKMKRDAAAEVLSSTVLPGDKANLGLVGKEVTKQ
jgi:hypothetical protein